MDMPVVLQNLERYITEEMSAAALYHSLAEIAPNETQCQMLMEFADDEQNHANEFKRIYRMMTGRKYTPQVNQIKLNDTYENVLKERIVDESGDYRKYGEQYMLTEQNIPLSEAYYKAMIDENVHAVRIIYLLEMLDNSCNTDNNKSDENSTQIHMESDKH